MSWSRRPATGKRPADASAGASVVGEPPAFALGRVGRVMLGAALLIALLRLPPQPAAINPTARAAAKRTTLLVRRRMTGSLRAFALRKLLVAST